MKPKTRIVEIIRPKNGSQPPMILFLSPLHFPSHIPVEQEARPHKYYWDGILLIWLGIPNIIHYSQSHSGHCLDPYMYQAASCLEFYFYTFWRLTFGKPLSIFDYTGPSIMIMNWNTDSLMLASKFFSFLLLRGADDMMTDALLHSSLQLAAIAKFLSSSLCSELASIGIAALHSMQR